MSHDLLQLPSGPAGAARRRRGRQGAGLRIAACLAVIVLALAWVAVRGLTGNFVYYLTPTDIVAHHKAQAGQRVRLGGYVVPGSIHHRGSVLMFTVTDRIDSMQVSDSGPFPVHADRTFNVDEQRAGGEKVTLNGVLDNGGAAHGTFELKTTAGGFSCDTGSVSWRAHH